MNQKNKYLARQAARDQAIQEAMEVTMRQIMVDTLILTLNDPEVMGSDTFGYSRLMKVLDGWDEKYETYAGAITKGPEADYLRGKLDQALKQIVGKKGEFHPFEERYQWVAPITYDKK